jgi:hypothetical protein
MAKKIKKKYIILGSILVILIIGRLMLPYFVTRFVNKVLADIPGYAGSIDDVDISLLRGAYVIHELKLFKIEGDKRVPFIDIPATDLSIEWSALFKGSIVGEVIFENPKLNFIGGDKKNAQGETTNQSGEDVDWTVPLKKLMPLQINRMEIVRGNVVFYDFTTKPEVNVYLNDLNMMATNLNNADKQEAKLPSKVIASASSIGNGKLSIDMNINVLKQIPDLDMDMKFENISMPALNEFFQAYSKVDIEKGAFNLYSEMIVDNGVLDGYVKPLATDVKVVNWQNDKEKPLNLAWQSVVGFFVEVFENQRKDQFATKVPLTGDFNNVKTEFWPTLWNIFRNGFIKAFERNTDNTIKFTGKEEPVSADNKKSDREKKKEERKKRRQERKDAKKERKQAAQG